MRVLVVDDDKLNLKVADGFLKNCFTDYYVILCQEPTKVMGILEAENIDILLLDIIMPELSGIDLLRQIRSNDFYRDIQVIMLTSLNDKDSFKACFELGANDYILKPIDITEFQARLHAAEKARNNTRMLREMLDMMKEQNNELKTVNSLLKDTQFHLIQSGKMSAIGELATGVANDINAPIGDVYNQLKELSGYHKIVKDYIDFSTDSLDKIASRVEDEDTLKIIEAVRNKHSKLNMKDVTKNVDSIVEESQKDLTCASEIVQSLLNLSWINPQKNNARCRIDKLIEQVLLVIRNEASKVVEITNLVPELSEVYCNQGEIGQVILNIVINAVQAIKHEEKEGLGHIYFNGYEEENYISIRIYDDGPGIPRENLDKIFKPFFTCKEGQGTGLGLSISYDIIVNKHKGMIYAESELEKGAAFIIKLPKVTN
ncbi:MAG: hybrid sensor histidine kinase/response regulator [Firmicutes bacterium HGW-Firmicutes-1]|jgi:signal transduction histidine kinase|nr:MAG: hybrid sensor histidine kinase/response regulator [Firmicutes bacterium HGW-Firmicutes-1]